MFSKVETGTVFNPAPLIQKPIKPTCKSVVIKFPSRLNAMALDASKIAENNNMKFSAGEIAFCVDIFHEVSVEFTTSAAELDVDEKFERRSLVVHSAKIMRSALGVSDGLRIDIREARISRHTGLGSSSGLIAAVAVAINELYGNPFTASQLIRYLAQNHVEEIDGEESLVQQVQCLGGSAACGLTQGSLIVLAGESQVIKAMKIDENRKVVIGVPKDSEFPDSATLMKKEELCLYLFKETGERFGREIAYRMLHQVLPSMNNKDLGPVGDLIFDYRFNMGSIANCSHIYNGLSKIGEDIRFLKEENLAEVLSLSSVGPGFFAITETPETILMEFERHGLVPQIANLHDGIYEVVERDYYD